MLRRILLGVAVLTAAAIAVPPLWFTVFRDPPPELPPPGREVVLPSGVGVNVVEVGSGPPVVLVHGLPGCAYDWRALSGSLANRGRRALAYDRVGFGRSDPRPEDISYTVEQNARELLGLLEALDLRDTSVVGWSYGGGTAILAAHQDPSRMGRLVLVGSAGPGIEETGPSPVFALIYSDPVQAWLRAVPPVSRGLQAALSETAFSGQPQPDWWLPTLAANFAQPHTGRTFREEGQALGGPPPDPTGLDLPVLVIHGDDDRLVPLAVGRELHRRAPRSRLLVIEDGSHMLPITHADELADEIVRSDSIRRPG